MRVTLWSERGSACIIVEHEAGKICCVTSHAEDATGDAALAETAAGAALLIYPGNWERGLALKRAAAAKLLALYAPEGDALAVAERAARESSNVFVALQKMRLDL